MANQHTDGWTEKEIEYLRMHVGVISLELIAKRLKRSYSSVEHKILDLGLENMQEMSGLVTVHHLATILNVDDKAIYRWIEKYDFPVMKLNLRKSDVKPRNYVDIKDFWIWADKHKTRINWFKVERRVLVPEPGWVEECRRTDFYKKPKKQSWSKAEDRRVWTLYYTKGLPQKEIAEIMGRSVNSIEKRLKRLRESGFALEMAS